MTEQEEQYIYFASSIENLNNAWRILKHIRRRKNNSLKGVAFKYALIEYSKPYTRSDGIHKKGRDGYKLDESFIPLKHIGLHKSILDSRQKKLAHADLTVKEAKLHVSKTKSGKFVGIVQNAGLGTELLTEIDIIIELIEKTLDNMYMEEKRLESLLPINS